MNRDQFIWQKWLDPETSQWLTEYFADRGVTLMMQENLNGFEGKTILKNIQTKSGSRFAAGMAIVAVGADRISNSSSTPLSAPKRHAGERIPGDRRKRHLRGGRHRACFPTKFSTACGV